MSPPRPGELPLADRLRRAGRRAAEWERKGVGDEARVLGLWPGLGAAAARPQFHWQQRGVLRRRSLFYQHGGFCWRLACQFNFFSGRWKKKPPHRFQTRKKSAPSFPEKEKPHQCFCPTSVARLAGAAPRPGGPVRDGGELGSPLALRALPRRLLQLPLPGVLLGTGRGGAVGLGG